MLGKGQGGTGWSSPQYFGGRIYEVMLFSSDLSDYNIKRLEGYLAHKWNSKSNLPASHPFKSTAPTFGGSQSIVSAGNTVPVVSGSPTLSFDIGKFTLEEYGYYATSGLPLSYATSNAAVLAIDSATGKLDPKGAGTASITISQAGDTHFSAASSISLNLTITAERSQTITFASIPDCNTTVSTINLSASTSSGLAVTFTSSDTNVATISGSTLTIVEAGTVTITASQAGGTDPSNSNITYSAAAPVAQTFTINAIGYPMTVTLDDIGTMGLNQSFKPRTTVIDTTTGKVLNGTSGLSITYTITSGTIATVSGNTVTTDSAVGAQSTSVTLKATAALAGYATTSKSKTFSVDGSASGQTITFKYGEKGGLRDMPLSRKPISIGLMAFTNAKDSNNNPLGLSFRLTNNENNVAKIVNPTGGKNAVLVLADPNESSKFSGFGGQDSIEVTIEAYRNSGDGYHAASVSKTIKIKAPSKSAFFEARKMDDRYEDKKNVALTRLSAKGISGEKALALFDSDNYDSDGDGISNALERAFGGDSLQNDSTNTLPKPIKSKPSGEEDHEFITFLRYNSNYNTEGIQYIVETSRDLRTWLPESHADGAEIHGSAVETDGGMERVVYKSKKGRAEDGHDKIFIRVRVKTK